MYRYLQLNETLKYTVVFHIYRFNVYDGSKINTPSIFASIAKIIIINWRIY